MDIRKVKKLIELLEESGLVELEIKEGEESIRLSRAAVSVPVMSTPQLAPVPAATPPITARVTHDPKTVRPARKAPASNRRALRVRGKISYCRPAFMASLYCGNPPGHVGTRRTQSYTGG